MVCHRSVVKITVNENCPFLGTPKRLQSISLAGELAFGFVQGHSGQRIEGEDSLSLALAGHTQCAGSRLVTLSTFRLSETPLAAVAVGPVSSVRTAWGAEIEVLLWSIEAGSRTTCRIRILDVPDGALLLPCISLRWVDIDTGSNWPCRSIRTRC